MDLVDGLDDLEEGLDVRHVWLHHPVSHQSCILYCMGSQVLAAIESGHIGSCLNAGRSINVWLLVAVH